MLMLSVHGIWSLFFCHPELVEGSLPLVPKFHLGTRLPRQFHCRPRRGNPCTNQRKMKFREEQGTFPNEIWERGKKNLVILSLSKDLLLFHNATSIEQTSRRSCHMSV